MRACQGEQARQLPRQCVLSSEALQKLLSRTTAQLEVYFANLQWLYSPVCSNTFDLVQLQLCSSTLTLYLGFSYIGSVLTRVMVSPQL